MNCITKQVAPILPVEIKFNILLLLSPNELLPLRTVSKEFRAIIDDPLFWRRMYANALLPRPPGPFSWQSTKFLQRTLVQSARLAQRWTSQPVNVISTRSLRTPSRFEFSDWLCGRWLLTCIEKRRLVSYDLDTGSEQTLYQSDDRWTSWKATSCLMSTRGHLLYAVVYDKNRHSGDRVKLLEFQADADSGYLSGPVISNVPVSLVGPGILRIRSGDTPFVLISVIPLNARATTLIFDTRSQIFYRFPKIGHGVDTEGSILRIRGEKIMLTMTHIILSCISSSSFSPFELIQAYVIPDDNETHELRLSHETIPDVCLTPSRYSPVACFLLRNSVIDPITGSTHLRILQVWPSYPNQELVCTDITLPANTTLDVLPISIHNHAVFTDGVYDLDMNIFLSSTDGFARGLCALSSASAEPRICKFTIDGTGETCVGVVGDPFSLSMDGTYLPIGSFDGIRGRILLTNRDHGAVVLDIE